MVKALSYGRNFSERVFLLLHFYSVFYPVHHYCWSLRRLLHSHFLCVYCKNCKFFFKITAKESSKTKLKLCFPVRPAQGSPSVVFFISEATPVQYGFESKAFADRSRSNDEVKVKLKVKVKLRFSAPSAGIAEKEQT